MAEDGLEAERLIEECQHLMADIDTSLLRVETHHADALNRLHSSSPTSTGEVSTELTAQPHASKSGKSVPILKEERIAQDRSREPESFSSTFSLSATEELPHVDDGALTADLDGGLGDTLPLSSDTVDSRPSDASGVAAEISELLRFSEEALLSTDQRLRSLPSANASAAQSLVSPIEDSGNYSRQFDAYDGEALSEPDQVELEFGHIHRPSDLAAEWITDEIERCDEFLKTLEPGATMRAWTEATTAADRRVVSNYLLDFEEQARQRERERTIADHRTISTPRRRRPAFVTGSSPHSSRFASPRLSTTVRTPIKRVKATRGSMRSVHPYSKVRALPNKELHEKRLAAVRSPSSPGDQRRFVSKTTGILREVEDPNRFSHFKKERQRIARRVGKVVLESYWGSVLIPEINECFSAGPKVFALAFPSVAAFFKHQYSEELFMADPSGYIEHIESHVRSDEWIAAQIYFQRLVKQ